jgi:hypothetical protein
VVVLAIAIPILFCLLGGISGYFLLTPPDSGWVRLAEPPGKAVHITFIRELTVRVQTQDGQIYTCNAQQCERATFATPSEPVARVLFSRDGEHMYAQTPQGVVYACTEKECPSEGYVTPPGEIVEEWLGYFRMADGQVFHCGSQQCEPVTMQEVGRKLEAPVFQPPPPPPGRVIEHKAATCYNCESYVQSDALLMEDGSLWSWTIFRSNLLLVTVILFGLGGLAVGVAISLVILLLLVIWRRVRRIRNRRAPSSAGTDEMRENRITQN